MREQLQAQLDETLRQLDRGRITLQKILDSQEEVLTTLHRLEGRAELLRELLAAGEAEEEEPCSSPPG